MQPNATELKVSPLTATPDEANQGQLAQCLRVTGGPNEGSANYGHGLAHSHEVNT